jgi:catechol 2,3-dioxygenase-like lactoylglutathione lyase family enzyme
VIWDKTIWKGECGMLGKQTLVAFVATSDAERARAFYEETLGLSLVSNDPFALVFEANGTTIRVQKVASFAPQPFTALGWSVDDINAVVFALRQKGVSCERFPGMDQDAHGVWASPSGARVAWFKDPDGNVLSLTEFLT